MAVTTSGTILNGVAAGNQSGSALAGLGDVNDDGIVDLIIGAPTAAGNAGESYVVFGRSGGFGASLNLSALDGSNGFTLEGVLPPDRSGFAVSGAGDLNDDGIPDIVVAAREASPNGASSGAVYVVFGQQSAFSATVDLSALNGSNGFRLNGIDPGDLAGNSVANAGDVNGDGIDDLIIGARDAAPGGRIDAGETYVVFGQSGGFAASVELSSLNGSNGFTLNGIAADDRSGRTVSSAGDFNGDGVDDILIGAGAGGAFLVYGDSGGFAASIDLSSLSSSTGFRITTFNTGDPSGREVAALGDVNGDGFDDVIVSGGAGNQNGQGESGVIYGRPSSGSVNPTTLDAPFGFRLVGADPFDDSGDAVAGVGDVNGDGIADILIGASQASQSGGMGAGEVYLVFGAETRPSAVFELSSIDGRNGYLFRGLDEFDASGSALAGVGDVNADGAPDFVIGAFRGDPNGNFNAGESYLIYGGADRLRALDRADGIEDGSIELANLGALIGDDANDDIVLPTNRRSASGLDGDDTIAGSGDDEFLYGDRGRDLIFGGAGADQIYGGRGADSLYGGEGADSLFADNGSDLLRGGAGQDLLTGGAGVTTFEGGAGDDTLIAGGRDDVYQASVSGSQGVNVDLRAGAATDEFGDSDELVAIANAKGRGFADTLVGDDGGNELRGQGGGDFLTGGDGSDTISGGLGSDWYVASERSDSGIVVEQFRSFAFVVDGFGAIDTLFSIENFEGTVFGDFIEGASAANRLNGGDGEDTLMGGAGKDTISGGVADDLIDGGLDNDKLRGNGGRDVFAFGLDTGFDEVKDFQDGKDQLSFAGTGLVFADLRIDAKGSDARIRHSGDGVVIVENLDPSDLDPGDFVF
ncbi:MAG: hypothetical protein AAFW46_08425 [Pseudomonadota bacterium]